MSASRPGWLARLNDCLGRYRDLLSTCYVIATIAAAVFVYYQLGVARQQAELAAKIADLDVKLRLQRIIRDPSVPIGQRLAATESLISVERDHGRQPDLRWAQLQHADLSGWPFQGVRLDFADLSYAKIDRTNFMDSRLCNTKFSGVTYSAPPSFDRARVRSAIDMPPHHGSSDADCESE